MKKAVKVLLVFCFTFFMQQNVFSAECDQSFEGNFLRYNYSYRFYDEFYNLSSRDVYLNTWNVDYINPNYLDKGQEYDNGYDWDWTPQVKTWNYRIAAGTSSTRILQNRNIDWRIARHPTTRTNATASSYDFRVRYTIGYDYSNNYPDASDDIQHTECAYYSVTWCGDGVVDPAYGEVCDPNDPSQTGWGSGGCDAQCQPIGGYLPTCNSLTATPSSSSNGSLVSNFACTGNNMLSYQIDCGNGQVFTGTGSGAGNETVNETCSYNANGSYNGQCTINGNITSPSCTATVSVGNGGSGGGPDCEEFIFGTGTGTYTETFWDTREVTSPSGLTYNENFLNTRVITEVVSPDSTNRNITHGGSSVNYEIPITCRGDGRSYYAYVDCGNGTQTTIEALDGSKRHTFTCNYTDDSSLYRPQCYVGGNSTNVTETAIRCTGRIALSTGVCGDGVIQNPNSNGEEEQCDYGDRNGNNSPDDDVWCDTSCKTTINTIPDNGEIIIGPWEDVIVGDGVNPFEQIATSSFIKNNSNFDVDIGELCVLKKSGASLEGDSLQCMDLGRIQPGEQESFDPYPNFVSNVDLITSGSYDDNVLFSTIRHDGTLYSDLYFGKNFNIRVSKPSIATIGGGTSFVNNSESIANIEKVTDENRVNENSGINDNFVGVGVSKDLSSTSKQITESGAIDKVNDEGIDKNNDISNVIEDTSLNTGVTTNSISEFENFNGLENVFILRNKNFEIDGTNSSSFGSGPRTYIIEDGNLTIFSDIIYHDNIAFIVKGGDLRINESVKEMYGTYIVIPKNSIGGKIQGIGGKTTEVLTIYGAIHGNINDLVSHRIKISENNEGFLDVGTIVSFGSSVFRQPAPLTGQFLGEYIESQKIAQ